MVIEDGGGVMVFTPWGGLQFGSGVLGVWSPMGGPYLGDKPVSGVGVCLWASGLLGPLPVCQPHP